MVKIISIEGNIGSGKSTIVSYLKQFSKNNFIFLQEPVDEWTSVCDKNGESILSHFYRDSKRYSFQFQMMAYISRLNLLRSVIKENPNAVIITERCLYTDKFVFAKMLYDKGDMTDIEYTIYNKWFSSFIDDIEPCGIIYIKTMPETCFVRINKRNRDGENIPLEYLKSCHDYHDIWLTKPKVPLIVYDGNVEMNDTNILDIIYKIDNAIMELIVQKTVQNTRVPLL
jgi:deoxyadenosine/deoxycytidine kinase